MTSCCFYDSPSTAGTTVPGNWREVTLEKKSVAENGTISIRHTYIEDISNGDLYLNSNGAELTKTCAALILGLPFYTFGVMFADLVKIVTGIVGIAERAFKEIRQQPVGEALATLFFALTWEVPAHIATSLWHVVKAPLYAVAFFFACLYGLVNPYDGRKWIGKIEQQWHESDYRGDWRSKMQLSKKPKGSFENTCEDIQSACQQISLGKMHFYALCMQKRGNVHDKVANLTRFIRVTA